MKRSMIVVALALLGAVARADDSPTRVIFSTYEFYVGRSRTPPCTALEVKKVRKISVELRGLHRDWGKILVGRQWWDKLFGTEIFESLAVCIAKADQYKGRTTPKMVSDLENGRLTAGMPIEFAEMLLGPADKPVAISSMLDPLTKQPVVSKTYVWVSPLRGSGFRQVLGLVSVAALGVAVGTGNIDTAIDALRVSAMADVLSTASWSLVDLSKAHVVTLEVDTNNTITVFTAQ